MTLNRSILAVTLAAACVGAYAQPAHASSRPKPVRASSVLVVRKKTAPKAWQLVPLTTIAQALTAIVGVPLAISCDTPGVPSPLDGHTLDSTADGEVFRILQADGTYGEFGPVVHVSVAECLAAQRVERTRDPNPTSWMEYAGERYDDISAAPLEVMLHEAYHIALQSGDEGLVDCTAVTHASDLATSFGLPAAAAEQLRVGIIERHASALPVYHANC